MQNLLTMTENTNTQQSKTLKKAERIIYKHVMWSMAAGVLPLHFVDSIAVMFIQNDMLKQLCHLYNYDYDENIGKSIVSSIIASSTAEGISMLFKSAKGADRVIMPIISGAFTYAMGRFFISFFEKGIGLIDIDFRTGEELFNEYFEKGKEAIKNSSIKTH